MKRLPLTHLLVIIFALAALAALAFWYTNSRDEVDGLPQRMPTADGPQSPEECKNAGGVWNECASPCPQGEICIQVCVAKCEFSDK